MSFRDDKERAALESKLQALKDRLSGLGSVASGIFRWGGQYASFKSSP